MSKDRRTDASHQEASLSRQPIRFRPAALVALLALALAPLPLAAEWLVLQDGREIETKGPWTVDGRRITYTAMNGTFSAIRTAVVDLDKSRLRNQPPPPSSPPPAVEKEPGLVVRQGDVTVARPPERSDGEEVDAPSDEAGRIAVVEWDEVVVADGTRIEGRLRNDTESTYLALVLDAKLLGENGRELASSKAGLEKNWIGRGETLRFRADFDNVIAFDTVRFEVDGQPMGRATDNSLVSQDRPNQEPDSQSESQDPPL